MRTIFKRIWWPGIVAALLAMTAFIFAARRAPSNMPGEFDFYLHQDRYRDIVAQVKVLPKAAGAPINKRIDDLAVVADRSRSGSYIIQITTVDADHAGVYGYVYSDKPLTMRPIPEWPDSQGVDTPGNLTFASGKIAGQDGHWWSVYNNTY